MACESCSLGLHKLFTIFSDNNKLLTFLESHNLIKLTRKCKECDSVIQLNANNLFGCDKTVAGSTCDGRKKIISKCGFYASPRNRNETFFEHSHLKLQQILELFYWFVLNRLSQAEVAEQVSIELHTVNYLYSFCREVVEDLIIETSEVIGEPDKVLEIDKAVHFLIQKYPSVKDRFHAFLLAAGKRITATESAMKDGARITIKGDKKVNPVLKECFVLLDRIPTNFKGTKILKCSSLNEVKQELSSKVKQESIEEKFKFQRTSEDLMPELKQDIQTRIELFGDSEDIEFQASISQVKQELSSKVKQESIEEKFKFQITSEDLMPELKQDIQTSNELFGDSEDIEFQASISQIPKLPGIDKIKTEDENSSRKRSDNNFSPFFDIPLIENSDNIHTTSHSLQCSPNFNAFNCSKCKIYFCSKNGFNAHILTVHEKSKQFECLNCYSTFSSKRGLNGHSKYCNGKLKQFKCTICGLAFSKKIDLLNHMDSELDKTPYCDYSCQVISSLLYHIKSVHVITLHKELEHFKCPNCELEFSNMADLSKHMKIYPFMCPYCDYAYRFESAFLNHLTAVHKKLQPINSSAKDESFGISRVSLFKCLHCEYTCLCKKKLSRHFVTFHKELVHLVHFKCPNCELVFSSMADLYKHMKIYPFKCLYCDYSYRLESALTNHLISVHEKKQPINSSARHEVFGTSRNSPRQKLHSKGNLGPFEEEFIHLRTSEDLMPGLKQEIQKRNEFFRDVEHIELISSISQVKQEPISKVKQEPIEEEFKLQRNSEFTMPELKQEIQASDDFFRDIEHLEFPPSISQELSSKEKQEPIKEEFHLQRTSENFMPELNKEIQTSDEFFRDIEYIEFLPSISQVKQELNIKVKQEPFEEEVQLQRTSEDSMPELKQEIQTNDAFSGDSEAIELLPSISQISKLTGIDKIDIGDKNISGKRSGNNFSPLCDAPLIEKSDNIHTSSNKPIQKRIKIKKKIEPFVCNYCNRKFNQAEYLLEHIKSFHETSEPCKCPHCEYTCMCKKDLSIHLIKVHKELEHFKCPNCELVFSSRLELYKHRSMCPFLCTYCDYSCRFKWSLLKHIKLIHKTEFPPFKCLSCNYACSTKIDLQKHNRSNHKEIKLVCNDCNVKFSEKEHLLEHINSFHETSEQCKCLHCEFTCICKKELYRHIIMVHKELNHIMCSYCELAFSSMADLVKHKKMCPFMCPYCDYSCHFKASLLDHINLFHETVLSPFICLSCNYASSSKVDLKRHIKSAHKKIKLVCNYCNVKFSQKEHLLKHIKLIHETVLPPFKCLRCNYDSSSKVDLKRHIKSAHRPIQIKLVCNYCNLKFIKNEHLLDHIKLIHETSEPCKCLHCEFTCTCKNELSSHIITVHKELEHFKCPNCDLVFSSMADLSKHMKTYPFMCPYCDYSYRFEVALKNHLTAVHPTKKSFNVSARDDAFGIRRDKPIQKRKIIEKYICKYCNMKFTQKICLLKHITSIHEIA